MKTIVLTLIAILALTATVPAKAPETLNIRLGARKTADRGKVTIKFLAVVEDSRCPINARCVWAGNAKIKVAVSKGRAAARIVELNSTLDPRAVSIYGYDFTLEDLTPRPGERGVFPIGPTTAKISIEKSRR